jgi:hypothetical protein
VFRNPIVLLSLLVLAAIDASSAQSAARQDTSRVARSQLTGTWSARSASGVTLMGTWTAIPDTANSTITGTWKLIDAQSRMVAEGGWSAAKSPTQWAGAWRAIVAGRDGEYSGKWTAGTDLKGNARFADLFEKAAQTVVSGTWSAGSQSGAWSIRTIK